MSRPRRSRAPRPRAESKRATRVALIEAGIEEIGRHGLDASLDAICARAGLTRGAFYVHFADRDAFIVAVMQQVLGSFVAAVTGPAQPRGIADAVTMFFAAAGARAPAVHSGSALRFHHVMEACRRSRAIGDAYRGLVLTGRDQLAAGLARDQEAGQLRMEIPAPALADVMIIAALGVAAALELELPIDLARVGRSMLGVLAR